MNPFAITLFRMFFACCALLPYLWIRGKSIRPYLWAYKHLFICAFLLNALPSVLLNLGETWIDSSTAGIVEGSTPIFTFLMAYYLFGSKEICRRKLLGIFLGFLGLLIIFLPTMMDGIQFSSLGFLCLIAMVICFAIGFLYSARHLANVPPIESATLQMLFALLLISPTLLFPSAWTLPSLKNILLLFALGALGTSCSWLLYFYMLKKTGPSNVSIATMLCPLFALMLGNIVLSETITWYKILGASTVLLSIPIMTDFSKSSQQVLQSREGDH